MPLKFIGFRNDKFVFDFENVQIYHHMNDHPHMPYDNRIDLYTLTFLSARVFSVQFQDAMTVPIGYVLRTNLGSFIVVTYLDGRVSVLYEDYPVFIRFNGVR